MTYAGATARLTEDRARALDPARWTWQPKVDGAYALIVTDGRGVLLSAQSRNGRPFGTADLADLIGVETGHQDAILIGEIECHTEAGVAARKIRGYPLIHLYDAARLSGVDCTAVPYSDRLARLHAERSLVECDYDDPYGLVDGGRSRRLLSTGQFVRFVPRDHRRLPIVESRRDFASLWRERVVVGGGEGLVACRLDAKLGARASKCKIKPTEDFSAVIIDRDKSCVTLNCGGVIFACQAGAQWCSELAVGDLVDFACDGWNARAIPKHPRLVRPRPDLD